MIRSSFFALIVFSWLFCSGDVSSAAENVIPAPEVSDSLKSAPRPAGITIHRIDVKAFYKKFCNRSKQREQARRTPNAARVSRSYNRKSAKRLECARLATACRRFGFVSGHSFV